MATLNTSQPPQPRTEVNRRIEPFPLPILLEQLQLEAERSRRRKAFWISVSVHAVLLVLLWTSAKWYPWLTRKTIAVATPEQLIREQKELTYLATTEEAPKLTERPKTDVISDKDRIAGSRNPHTPTYQPPRKPVSSGTPGAPRPAVPFAPPAQTQEASPAAQAPAGQPQNNLPAVPRQGPIYPGANQTARSRPNPFAAAEAVSPRAAIEQAARAAASAKPAGDYGVRSPNNSPKKAGIEILSDTMGVDFGPYLSRLAVDVRRNWLDSLPQSAWPPMMKRGRVVLQVAIMKDGSIGGMTLLSSSGDASLDRAAWAGISTSAPFPPLPAEFRGNYLLFRADFDCNTDTYTLR